MTEQAFHAIARDDDDRDSILDAMHDFHDGVCRDETLTELVASAVVEALEENRNGLLDRLVAAIKSRDRDGRPAPLERSGR